MLELFFCLIVGAGGLRPARSARRPARPATALASTTPSWLAAASGDAEEGEPHAWRFSRKQEQDEPPCDVSRVRCVAKSEYTVDWARPPATALVLAKQRATAEEIDVVARIVARLSEDVDVLLAEPLYSRIRDYALDAEDLRFTKWAGEEHCSPDFVATYGGDGLLLYANSLFQKTPPPPTVAFAAGSLGFLAPFDVKVLEASLPWEGVEATVEDAVALEDGEWPVSLRMRLRCRVFSDGEEVARHEALNEVVLDRGASPFLSAIECFCNNEHLTTAQADGLIVATPTGSTAYSLAAGGPMLHPSANAIVFTPICPHSLSFRPMVFPDSATLRFDVDEDARDDAWVTFDGRDRARLRRGDTLVVEASPHPLPTVLRNGNTADWFAGLRTHFSFNVRRRQKAFPPAES